MLLLIALAVGIVGIVLGVKKSSRSSHTDASEIAPINSEPPPKVKLVEDMSKLDNSQEDNQTTDEQNANAEEKPSMT